MTIHMARIEYQGSDGSQRITWFDPSIIEACFAYPIDPGAADDDGDPLSSVICACLVIWFKNDGGDDGGSTTLYFAALTDAVAAGDVIASHRRVSS